MLLLTIIMSWGYSSGYDKLHGLYDLVNIRIYSWIKLEVSGLIELDKFETCICIGKQISGKHNRYLTYTGGTTQRFVWNM